MKQASTARSVAGTSRCDASFSASPTTSLAQRTVSGAFAAIVEYVVDRHVQPDSGLFASRRWRPRLRVGEFRHDQLQVARPGHLGAQRFFTAAGRPFCLYAVISPARRRPAQLAGELSAVLATVRFESWAAPAP